VQEVFDFELIKKLVTRSNFKIKFDAMHAVTGAYAKPIFVDALGAPAVRPGTALRGEAQAAVASREAVGWCTRCCQSIVGSCRHLQ